MPNSIFRFFREAHSSEKFSWCGFMLGASMVLSCSFGIWRVSAYFSKILTGSTETRVYTPDINWMSEREFLELTGAGTILLLGLLLLAGLAILLGPFRKNAWVRIFVGSDAKDTFGHLLTTTALFALVTICLGLIARALLQLF